MPKLILTDVHMLQDGTITRGVSAADLLPMQHTDDHDFWPECVVEKKPDDEEGMLRLNCLDCCHSHYHRILPLFSNELCKNPSCSILPGGAQEELNWKQKIGLNTSAA